MSLNKGKLDFNQEQNLTTTRTTTRRILFEIRAVCLYLSSGVMDCFVRGSLHWRCFCYTWA